MEIRYSRPFMQLFIAMGAVVTLVALAMLIAFGQFQVSLITGPFIMAFGISGLSGPLYRVDGDELKMRNFLGMTVRGYPLSALGVDSDARGKRRLVARKANGKARTLAREKSLLMDDASVARFIGKLSAETFR